MAAGEDGDERALHHRLLAEDDVGYGRAGSLHMGGGGFRIADDHLVEVKGLAGSRHMLISYTPSTNRTPNTNRTHNCLHAGHAPQACCQKRQQNASSSHPLV